MKIGKNGGLMTSVLKHVKFLAYYHESENPLRRFRVYRERTDSRGEGLCFLLCNY